VLSRRNTYYTVLAPQVIGAMHPANRQELARWLRTADGGRDSLSPYLRGAVTGAATPILLALDTTDVFDPPGLRATLAKTQALAGRPGDLDRVVKAVAGLKGIRLAVQVGPKLEGEMSLDCEEPAALAPVAKALVLEALASAASAVDDLDDWTARTQGQAV